MCDFCGKVLNLLLQTSLLRMTQAHYSEKMYFQYQTNIIHSGNFYKYDSDKNLNNTIVRKNQYNIYYCMYFQ